MGAAPIDGLTLGAPFEERAARVRTFSAKSRNFGWVALKCALDPE